MANALFATLALCALGCAYAARADTPIAVTPDSFARAESDLYFSSVVKDEGFANSCIAVNPRRSPRKPSSG